MSPETTNKALLFELLDSVLRSWWTVVAGVCFGIAGGVIAMHYLPKAYTAQTVMRMTAPVIPREFVRETVTEDLGTRLMTMREIVFSDSFMEELLDRYFGAPADPSTRVGLAGWLRSKLDVEVMPRQGMIYIAYEDSDPERAAGVVNALGDLCVAENTRMREGSAKEITDTVRRQADEAKVAYDATQLELTTFLSLNSFKTANYLDFNQDSLEAASNALDLNQTRQAGLRDQLQILLGQLGPADLAAVEDDSGAVVVDPIAQELAQLEAELETLRSSYTDGHPEIRAKLREIEDLKARARPSEEGGRPSPTLPASPLEQQARLIRSELDQLKREETKLRRDMGTYRARIRATPGVQADLDRLTEARDADKERLDRLQTQLLAAESGQAMEENQQGARLEVVEAARVPSRPTSPQPLLIHIVGIAVGWLLFVAPMPVKRALNPVIGSEAGLRAASDVPLLVSIPRMITHDNRGLKRRRLAKNLGLSLLFSAALVAVFAYFGPLGS